MTVSPAIQSRSPVTESGADLAVSRLISGEGFEGLVLNLLLPVLIFETGTMEWRRFTRWPLAAENGGKWPLKPLFLQPGLKLSFTRADAGAAFEEYVSDPAKPVPYVRRPVRWTAQATRAIASQVGYATPYSFSAAFRRTRGCPPSEFRARIGRISGD